VRTAADLTSACAEIRETGLEFLETIGDAQPPAQGWRVSSGNGATIVFKRHEKFGAMVAVSIL
jgi:hypothetical protein